MRLLLTWLMVICTLAGLNARAERGHEVAVLARLSALSFRDDNVSDREQLVA